MDALFAHASTKLVGGFEVRRSPSGAAVICAQTEAPWAAPSPAAATAAAATPATTATSAVEDMAAAFGRMVAVGPAAPAALAAAAAPAAAKQYKASELSLEERFASVRKVGEECIQASGRGLVRLAAAAVSPCATPGWATRPSTPELPPPLPLAPLQEEELLALLAKKPHPVCYDGFEPSGRMHIAQGILKAINVNRLTRAGCVFKFWVADWFALLNNKMGGDLKKIRTVGLYMIEVSLRPGAGGGAAARRRSAPPTLPAPLPVPSAPLLQVWKAAGMDMTNVEFLWASDEINNHANDYWLRVMDIARKFNVPRVSGAGNLSRPCVTPDWPPRLPRPRD